MLSSLSKAVFRTQRSFASRIAPFSNTPGSSEDAMVDFGSLSTARDAWEKSCYYHIDFKIPASAPVIEAVQTMVSHKVGCLAVTENGKVTGIVSERDYVSKIALLGRNSSDTPVSTIATMGSNLVCAHMSDSVGECMEKLLMRDIRHLPLMDDSDEIVGMLSIKDIIKVIVEDKNIVIRNLANMQAGMGAFFEHT